MPKDISNQRFGRLVAQEMVSRRDKSGTNRHYWKCKCDCGNDALARDDSLIVGYRKSCGCLYRERFALGLMPVRRTHGRSKGGAGTTYLCWISMNQRVNGRDGYNFKYYGSRGITICERWRDFTKFVEDMGERPSKYHTLDRIDRSKGYSPENCRWADKSEQARNRSSSIFVKVDDKPVNAMMLVENALKDTLIMGEPTMEFLFRNGITLFLKQRVRKTPFLSGGWERR